MLVAFTFITMKVPEIAFFELSLHYQLQEDMAIWSEGGTLFMEMYILRYTA